MKLVFNPVYIANKPVFYIYILVLLIIMILTIIFVKKEIGNKK